MQRFRQTAEANAAVADFAMNISEDVYEPADPDAPIQLAKGHRHFTITLTLPPVEEIPEGFVLVDPVDLPARIQQIRDWNEAHRQSDEA